jgi:signal transduction histidine kinase
MLNGSGLVLQLKPKVTTLGNVNLLIVADDTAEVLAIAKILKSADVNFTYDTISITEPFHNLSEQNYSAIIYNYYVTNSYCPKESLLQQLTWWYDITPKIPLILITDALGDELAVKLIESGVDGYVLRDKLFKLPDVLKSVLIDRLKPQKSQNQLNLSQLDLIRQQQEYIQKLETEKQNWEALEADKQEQISHLNHELRSPISSILGFAKMLKEQHYGPLNPKQMQYVSAVVTTGQHLLDLVNNYLVLAKIEADKQKLDLENLAVEDVCQASLFIVSQKAEDKGLKLILELADDVDFCTADPVRLKQILVNLIYNGIKFTDRGSVTLQVSLDDKFIKFAVIDTGIGISEANLQKLFQPFQQIKRHHEGTGLGLVLSRKLAQLHGGDIVVTSQEGKGSCFKLLLPKRSH